MKIEKKTIYILMVIPILITFGIFVYPTLYKYDKLEQKYPVKINRLTGKTEVLTNKGWNTVENISEDKMKSLRTELVNMLQNDKQNFQKELSEQVINQIKDEVISELKNEINKAKLEVENEFNGVKTEINQYKKFELDPNNYFTIGSTMNEVKKIMGVPSSTNEVYDGYVCWYYGYSEIAFENKKVVEYDNQDGNLRVR